MSDSTSEPTIGEVIAQARQNAGLSLRDLSGRIQIHFTYLADIEKNRVIPSETVIKNISLQNELKLEFDELMALAGRLGEKAEAYLKTSPQFGRLVRLIAHEELSSKEVLELTEKTQFLINQIKNK